VNSARLANAIVAAAGLCVAVAAALMLLGGSDRSAAGEVRLLRNASSEFDPFIGHSTQEEQAFFGERYFRFRGYASSFGPALEWAPPTHFYRDLYAIYNNPRGERQIAEHPDWVLRDRKGRPLYIPFDCGRGSCPQFAADVGNPAWRADWIRLAREDLAQGYAGIFVDDVNLVMRVSDGDGRLTAPIDPRTRAPMTEADWRRYVAEFTEEIERAFPDAEIAHNAIWYAGHDDTFTVRQLLAADYIELERGINDPGLVGGGHQFGLETLLEHVDWLHDRGKPVILEPYVRTEDRLEYELAGYFLINEGGDLIVPPALADPDDFWPGWGTRLGEPEGDRYEWEGVLRRDFEHGLVLLNQPGAPPRTLDLPEPQMLRPDGSAASSVTLGPADGAVLTHGA
jgi:hypothetical protein